MERPFEVEEIEDVRIIIKAKGKHWGLTTQKEVDSETGAGIRKLFLLACLDSHEIVTPALEDIKKNT